MIERSYLSRCILAIFLSVFILFLYIELFRSLVFYNYYFQSYFLFLIPKKKAHLHFEKLIDKFILKCINENKYEIIDVCFWQNNKSIYFDGLYF